MSPSEKDFQDSFNVDLERSPSYTLALSSPSLDLSASPLSRSFSDPITNRIETPTASQKLLMELFNESSRVEDANGQDFTRARKKAGKQPGGAVDSAVEGKSPQRLNQEIHFRSDHYPNLQHRASTNTVEFQPLEEILPISNISGSPSLHRESTNRISEFKEWVPEVEKDPIPCVNARRRKLCIGWGIACASLLFVLLLPPIIFAVGGSRFSVLNYFRSLDLKHQIALVDEINSRIMLTDNWGIANVNALRKLPFNGLVYSPKNTMEPKCGFTQQDAILDIALLSSVTNKLRTYGTQCNQAAYILNGIHQMGLNMTLMLGVWIGEHSEGNEEQIKQAKSLLYAFPSRYFESVMIGNEALYRGDISEAKLIEAITDMKEFLAKKRIDVPVGTCEMGSFVTETLLENLDIVGVNILPFFTGLPAEEASQWVPDYLASKIAPLNKGNCTISISEVGWPYIGGDFHDSVADPATFQQFMSYWLCNASSNLRGIHSWYYYEAFDEPWKNVFHSNNSKWETEWGVFGQYRDMKANVSFPTC